MAESTTWVADSNYLHKQGNCTKNNTVCNLFYFLLYDLILFLLVWCSHISYVQCLLLLLHFLSTKQLKQQDGFDCEGATANTEIARDLFKNQQAQPQMKC